MIKKFVAAFMAEKDALKARYAETPPDSYADIVKDVVTIFSKSGDEDGWGMPDPERIHIIDDGSYQGTLLFVVAAQGYQPSTYWYVMVSYGSCSGCDTFEAIRGYCYGDDCKEERARSAEDYVTLALHIVQGFKKMGEEEV